MARTKEAPEGAPSLFIFPTGEQTTSSMERALLGALLLEPAAIPVVGALDVEDLAHPHHRALLLLLRRMHVAKKTWDPALILSILESDPAELEACGGSLQQISGYADECPSVEILPHYMEAIQDAAGRKRLRKVASQVAEEIVNATMDRRTDLAEVVERAKRSLHGALPACLPISGHGPDDTVWRQLSLNKERLPRPTLSNLYTIFRDDPRWAGLRLNRLGNLLDLSMLGLTDRVKHAADLVAYEALRAAETARWLATHYELEAGAQIITQALLAAAQGRAYHPVQEYLRSLTWDGLGRISMVRTQILGCPDDAEGAKLHDAYIERFLIASVARALRPGCKQDCALILFGVQGAQKSTFFSTLFGADWFADSPIPIGDKDAFIQLGSVWCYEAAEMEDLSKKTAEAIKQFLSASSDLYRAPFDREARAHPRHSVMVGSTNRQEFLTDETGDRRFWPITIPKAALINLDLVREWRDQLWAEAVALYDRGDPWWFTREELVTLGREADVAQYRDEDPWTNPVQVFTQSPVGSRPFRSDDVFDALKLDMKDRTKGNERRLAAVLRRLGYETYRDRLEDGTRPRLWRWTG